MHEAQCPPCRHASSCLCQAQVNFRLSPVTFKQTENAHVTPGLRQGGKALQISPGVDPIHFGIILICCCGIGFSTPPLGENMFIASGIANISLEEISLKALPLVAINIAVIAILVIFPDIVLFLPNLMGTGLE